MRGGQALAQRGKSQQVVAIRPVVTRAPLFSPRAEDHSLAHC
jgi:hypothetical protein